MEQQELFVLAITHIGPWLGTTTEENYAKWKKENIALHLDAPRSLQIIPMDDQGTKFGIQIGNPYMADTHQKKLDVFPIAVELLGELGVGVDGETTVSDHQQLWGNYNDALIKWRAAMSGLTIAGPDAMNNLRPMRNK